MVVGPWLARLAARRVHALLALAPGGTAARLSVEVHLAETGMVVAASPADADVLIVAGEPDDDLARAIDRVWAQLPGPRVRLQVETPGEAGGAIGRAVARLCGPEQRTDAAGRRDEWRDVDSVPTGTNGMDMDMPDVDDVNARHGGDHHAGPEDGDGGHADHGGHGIRMPGGLMMADRAPDRDGLQLDVLQVPLGPVLADWPAGLVVTLAVQGDVVQKADVRLLGSAVRQQMPFWDAGDDDRGRRFAAAHLDSLGRLLGVVGWQAQAWRARRLRDGALGDVSAQRLRAGLAVLDRRMRRSWTLRWATDGLGVLTSELARELGVTGPAARAVDGGGDVTARWRCWLAQTDRYLAGDRLADGEGPRGRLDGDRPASAALLDAAQRLMLGLDIAAARIVVASFDPDTDELVATRERSAA
jgi:hypothetical protein